MRRRSGCVLYDRQDLYRVRTSFGMEAGCERRMCMEQGFLSRSCSKKRPEASLVRPKYRMTSIGAQRVQCSNWYYVKEKSPVFVENIIGHATRTYARFVSQMFWLACPSWSSLVNSLVWRSLGRFPLLCTVPARFWIHSPFRISCLPRS